ncbi:MAG: hypothetical protein NWS32_07240 [Candidatus Nanopelagicales bacterium]|nr:hypothetical protein [Candidatus Nanopelagicales bacterium]
MIALVGDLKHGRTVHSLAALLARTWGASLRLALVSPSQLKMPAEAKEELAAWGCHYTEHEDLAEVVPVADILYVTRVQKERFASVDE